MTRPELLVLMGQKIITGNRLTTAQKLRDFETQIISGLVNIDDDLNQPNGYLGVDVNGKAYVSLISKVTPTGQFLADDGPWQTPGDIVYTGNSGVFQVGNNFSWNGEITIDTTIWGDHKVNLGTGSTPLNRFSTVSLSSATLASIDAGLIDYVKITTNSTGRCIWFSR